MRQDMRDLADCVAAAIATEEANVRHLLAAAKKIQGSPIADQLRDLARSHRIHALELQARLNAVLYAYGEPHRH